MAAFFIQPIAFGSWLPRIPDVQHRLDLSSAELATALLGMPLGILLILPFASKALIRLGSKCIMAIGFVLMLLSMPLAVWSVNHLMLLTTLAFVGATTTLVLLALNVEASATEKSNGILILGKCHGFGSFGLMLGSLIGTSLAAFSIPAALAVTSVAIALFPVAMMNIYTLPIADVPSVPYLKTNKPIQRIPDKRLLGIALFAFGIAMTEGAMADWSAVYLREIFDARGGAAGIGFTLFAAMVTVGRFIGDYLKANCGAVPTTRICGATALLGIIITLTASTISVAYIGFMLLGFGVSVGYPFAISAAANLPEQPASSNVATLTFIALLGFLTGPPLIGFIADITNIRVGLMVLVPVLTLTLFLTRELEEKPTVPNVA